MKRLAAYPMWLVYAGTWNFVGALSWTTAAVYLIRDVGMSPPQLVRAGTALEVAYFLCEVPTGVLADLYSRRLSLIVAALVSGIGMVLVGLAPSPTGVLLAMALWGLGWTFRSGAEDAWLADEVGASQLARAYQRGAQAERLAGLAGIRAAVGLAMVALWLPFVVAVHVRATVFSITNLTGSAGEWAGGPALGWVGTRRSVRTALAVGALGLSPVLALLGRAVTHQRRHSALIVDGPAEPRPDS